MLKIRRSHDRLIFNMGIPIPGKDGLYIETRPWWHMHAFGNLSMIDLGCGSVLVWQQGTTWTNTICQFNNEKHILMKLIHNSNIFITENTMKCFFGKCWPFHSDTVCSFRLGIYTQLNWTLPPNDWHVVLSANPFTFIYMICIYTFSVIVPG